MRTIGLFGGSFDPIHCGHIELALKCIEEKNFDEVWFILAYDQPLKDSHHESFDNRALLIEEAIKDHPSLKLLTIEKELSKPSYTYNTVKALKDLHPSDRFRWIIGSDNLKTLDQWYKIEDLLTMIDFLVVRRDQDLIKNYDSIDFDHPASSTSVRAGEFKYLSKELRDLIFSKKLYEDAILFSNLSSKRANHVKRCVEVALEISKHYDIDETKVYTAMLLHDITKEMDKDEELDLMKKYFPEQIHFHHKVYHQFTGSLIAKEKYLVEDEDILEAIKYHTTGESQKLLSKIIYVSDKVERGRPYPVEEYIALAKVDINEAFETVKRDGEEARKKKEGK